MCSQQRRGWVRPGPLASLWQEGAPLLGLSLGRGWPGTAGSQLLPLCEEAGANLHLPGDFQSGGLVGGCCRNTPPYVFPATQPCPLLGLVRFKGAFLGDQASTLCLWGQWAARDPSLLPPEALLARRPGVGAGAGEQPICLLAVLLFLLKGLISQEVPVIPGAHCAI